MIPKDLVKVIFTDGDYHLAHGKGKEIDRALFTTYTQVRELLNGLRAEIKSRINRPKDKPMVVMKNHYDVQTSPVVVAPREVVTFNQDETDPASEL